MDETKTEVYSFSMHEDGVDETVTFVVPIEKISMATFSEMCRRAALAFGYTEASVDESIPYDSDSFRNC